MITFLGYYKHCETFAMNTTHELNAIRNKHRPIRNDFPHFTMFPYALTYIPNCRQTHFTEIFINDSHVKKAYFGDCKCILCAYVYVYVYGLLEWISNIAWNSDSYELFSMFGPIFHDLYLANSVWFLEVHYDSLFVFDHLTPNLFQKLDK